MRASPNHGNEKEPLMLTTTDRVVLVSGANRGIGLAIARALYDAGHTLSLGARNIPALEAAVADWDPARVACHRFDADDYATHHAWIDGTVARFGRIDGLVNNAGLALNVELESDDDEGLDRLFAINVKSPRSMTRTAMPHLRKSGAGRVINIASMAGKAVFGTGIGYTMSKFALVALSHATRHAGWDDGVRCTVVCPSYVSTDMTAGVTSVSREQMIQPGDIAELVVTLMTMSNSASVAEVIVNCRDDVSM